jgi:hypothetical protein
MVRQLSSIVCEQLLDKLRITYPNDAAVIQSKLAQITQCCQHEDLITICNINQKNLEFDLAILSAILKGFVYLYLYYLLLNKQAIFSWQYITNK